MDIWQNFQSAAITLAFTLLSIALPVLAAFAIKWVRAKIEQIQREEGSYEYERFAVLAVKAVEQIWNAAEKSGTIDALAELYGSKRDAGICFLESFLEARGVNLDIDSLVALIESAVYDEFNSPKREPEPLPTLADLR